MPHSCEACLADDVVADYVVEDVVDLCKIRGGGNPIHRCGLLVVCPKGKVDGIEDVVDGQRTFVCGKCKEDLVFYDLLCLLAVPELAIWVKLVFVGVHLL